MRVGTLSVPKCMYVTTMYVCSHNVTDRLKQVKIKITKALYIAIKLWPLIATLFTHRLVGPEMPGSVTQQWPSKSYFSTVLM